ncbi:FadR/GntR family transcriptional regulator [Sphingomonas flavalba]|uniref:FadR/GntR family transcriptional regulator n=1 Tax=Sphingomonas flavalba TaxID=2559804 RepID=UPI0039E079AD
MIDVIEQAHTLSPPKAASRIAHSIRSDIANGRLKTGDRLPPERALMEQFKVSRPTLREAMRLLETESLIEIARGQAGGARVRALDIAVTARQVGIFLQIEGTTLADVWQARTMLEPPAAGLVATRRPKAVLATLRASVAASEEALLRRDAAAYALSVSQFSEGLLSGIENKTLTLLCRLLRDIVRRQLRDVVARSFEVPGIEKMLRLNGRGRERAIDLIAAGDVEATERFWRLHLAGSASAFVSVGRADMPIDMTGEDGT